MLASLFSNTTPPRVEKAEGVPLLALVLSLCLMAASGLRRLRGTLSHRKKLPAGKSEPTPAPVGPSSAPNILTAEEGPGRRGSRPGPSVLPGDSRGRWRNAAHDYTRSGIPFQPSKRGAEGRWLCAPTPPPPHPRGSAIATMKLRLGKGGEPTFLFLARMWVWLCSFVGR
jgi:hypothetical protein